jgi:hypothetical protein
VILPESGEFVVANTYWLRRIEEGAVIVTEPEAEKEKSKKVSKGSKE